MKPLSKALMALCFVFASHSLAAPTVNKDWMMDQGPDEVFGKDSCLAATNVSTGTHRSQLVLSFTKDRLSVPQLFLKVWDAPSTENLLNVRISSKVSHPLFVWKTPAQTGDPTVYWYAPIGWPQVLEVIASSNELTVQGTAVQNKISLRGSSATIDLVEKCLKTSSVLPADFLKQLNVKSTLSEAPYASIDEWIKALEVTFENYRQGLVKAQEREALLKPAAKLIAQEAEAVKAYDYAQRKFQEVTAELASKQSQEQALQQSLARSQGELQTLQGQLALAQDNLKIKKAAYDPARAQVDLHEKAVSNAERALNSNIQETKRLQNRISQLESEIPDLRDERDRLDRQISQLQTEIESTRRSYDDADWAARRYDVEAQTRSDLNNDWRYNNLIRRAQDSRAEARRAEMDVRNYQNQANQVNRDLIACREVADRDCSHLERQLQNVRNQAAEAARRATQADRDASAAEFEATRIANDIRAKHENEKRRLIMVRDDWSRKLSNLQAQQDNARSRRNQIDNEIPDLQSELRDARSRLPSLQAQRPGLETALNDARLKLDQIKVSLDYARLEREYRDAIAQVDSINKSIATTQKAIADTEKSLKALKPVIESLQRDLVRRTTARDKELAELEAIRAQLKPLREKEQILNAEIAVLAQAFEQGKSRYQKTYQTLLGN